MPRPAPRSASSRSPACWPRRSAASAPRNRSARCTSTDRTRGLGRTIRAFLVAGAIALAFGGIAAAGDDILVDAKDLRYDVHGLTARELLEDMQRQARGVGAEYFAKAQWYISWRFDYREPARGYCAVANPHVALVERTVMPRWSRQAAPAELVTRWQAFMKGLEAHELGHLEHGRAAAKDIHDKLLKLRDSDCERLGQSANAAGNAIIQHYSEADAAYDAATGHGRTQGAYWVGSK